MPDSTLLLWLRNTPRAKDAGKLDFLIQFFLFNLGRFQKPIYMGRCS